MKTRTALPIAIAAVCVTGLLSSCTSTQVTNVWKLPGLEQTAGRRVLVLAVLGNATSRRAVEDAVVRQLGQAGVEAIAGYSVSPTTGEIPKQRLAQVLSACGADAALVCRWQLMQETYRYRPGLTAGFRVATQSQRLARGEATLLDGVTLAKVWSAGTTMDKISGFRDAAPDFARTLVGAIRDDGALTCSAPTEARSPAALARTETNGNNRF